MSRYEKYSPAAMDLLKMVQEIVRKENRNESRLEDLSRAILITAIPDLVAIAKENNTALNKDRLKRLYNEIESQPELSTGTIHLTNEIRTVLDEAEKLAGNEKVSPEHIIHAAWPSIKGEIAQYFDAPPMAEEPTIQLKPEEITLPDIAMTPEKQKAIEFLQTLGRELTAKDRTFDVFGRDEEIDNLVSILVKYFKPNPLVIGEPGVGKTAIVEGLAERVKQGKVPPPLANVRIFEVRVSDLAAGTNVHGAFEERLKELVRAVETNPDIIIFLDEVHQVAQSYGNEPTADILKPALSRGKFRCIGATTVADFHRHLEKDEALIRRFQTVQVKEPSLPVVKTIMEGLRPKLESHYKLSIPDSALDRTIQIAGQFLPMRFFPDKAIDVIDRACSRAFFRQETEIGEKHLREAVTDIAAVRFEDDLSDTTGLANLETKIKRDIVGQDDAVRSVCNVLRICKKHLDLRPERPDGAFLFTGPTGVGKTALAESLARHLSGREDGLFRIDMSEFSESHSIARLIGAPPGYVGYGDIALLPAACEKNPAGVLLLDEFEKAHPQVHRLFLQVFDSGRVTDSYGKTLTFGNMTIIATCNVNDDNRQAIGFASTDGRQKATVPLARLKQVFPPELLNRFDEIVPFRGLAREDIRSILDSILVAKTNANLGAEYSLSIEFTEGAADAVIDRGYSPEFGARNLQRVFQEMVISPLADRVESLRGRGRIVASWDGERIKFE